MSTGSQGRAGEGKRTRKPRAAGIKPGRPKGSRTRRLPVVTVAATQCQKCGSTERGRYTRTTETPHPCVWDGRSYTHVVRRWTACAACGQSRIDRTLENRSAASKEAGTAPDEVRRAA